MSINKNKLVDSVENWLLKIEDKLKGGSEPIYFSGETVLTANEILTLDIKSFYPDHALYALLSSTVKIKLLDEDPESTTVGLWINSEAVVSYGIHPSGEIKIKNLINEPIKVSIAIDSPTAAPEPPNYGAARWGGEVESSDFINGIELADAVNFHEGIPHESYCNWLKFYIDGKVIYTPKRSFQYNLSWDLVNNAGLIDGDRTVVVKGHTYWVRCFKGTSLDGIEVPVPPEETDTEMTHGSEWNRTMYHISGRPFYNARNQLTSEGITEGDWAQYPELEIETRGDGSDKIFGGHTICQQTSKHGGITRGGQGVSFINRYSQNNRGWSFGWRPVLELIQD